MSVEDKYGLMAVKKINNVLVPGIIAATYEIENLIKEGLKDNVCSVTYLQKTLGDIKELCVKIRIYSDHLK